MRYSYSYLNYIQPQDEEVAKLMSALNTYKGEPLLVGPIGYIAVSKLVQTGRLFWKTPNPPLKTGVSRDLHFAWHLQDTGHYKLSVDIEPPAMVAVDRPTPISGY